MVCHRKTLNSPLLPLTGTAARAFARRTGSPRAPNSQRTEARFALSTRPFSLSLSLSFISCFARILALALPLLRTSVRSLPAPPPPHSSQNLIDHAQARTSSLSLSHAVSLTCAMMQLVDRTTALQRRTKGEDTHMKSLGLPSSPAPSPFARPYLISSRIETTPHTVPACNPCAGTNSCNQVRVLTSAGFHDYCLDSRERNVWTIDYYVKHHMVGGSQPFSSHNCL